MRYQTQVCICVQGKVPNSPVAEDLDRMSDASISRLRRMASDTQVCPVSLTPLVALCVQSGLDCLAPSVLALFTEPLFCNVRLHCSWCPKPPPAVASFLIFGASAYIQEAEL